MEDKQTFNGSTIKMRDGASKSPQEEEEDDEPKTVWELWLNFSDYTSTHGPNHVKRVRPLVGKIIWLVIGIIFLGLLLWQISLLFIKLLHWDFNVLIDVKYETQLRFPAVTLCNENPFR